MARTVTDMAKLLEVMVGYDPEDPLTALGVGQAPDSYLRCLDKDGLKGARIGILRESIGFDSEPETEDFHTVTTAFEKNVAELKAAGVVVVDPIVIPRLQELRRKGATNPMIADEALRIWLARNPDSPYKTREDIRNSPHVGKIVPPAKAAQWTSARPTNLSSLGPTDLIKYYEYMEAREELMVSFMKVMADHQLDAIVHKTVEHQPTLIRDGINPPYVRQKGVPTLNTFLIHTAAITVPSGFTMDDLPVGITFFGRPYSEPTLLKLAYSYEQETHHRVPPKTTPALLSDHP
jgi:Asp-tRNA(Asn)/Glu-tRNA(Gln) amidotransferase A subunit family amidase